MIVVIGASGHVGGALVDELAVRGHRVRAVSRRPQVLTVPPGVEVVAGDADDPAGLDAVFAGASAAFLMTVPPRTTDGGPVHDLRLAAAARRAGVGRLVKLSVLSGDGGGDVLADWNREAEAAVTTSGADWTLLRPGRFFSNALVWAPMLARGDVVHLPFAHRPAAGVDPADVAAVAARALTTDGLLGAAPRLTGPEVLTAAEEVAVLGEVLGRRLEAAEVPTSRAVEGMRGAGMSEAVVDAVVGRVEDSDEGAEVLSAVPDLLGRPATTFRAWATAHADVFARPR